MIVVGLQTSMLSIVCVVLLPRGSHQGMNERNLLQKLALHDSEVYNKLERPVINESDPLVVQFGLTLQQIIGVDEKNQILTTNIWLNIVWNDYNLRWNESDYGGIKQIRVPANMIWKPDILMYNSADEDIDSTFPTNVVVSSNGDCLWVPPGMYFSTCKIDITWFPFDEQKCAMKFGSWTYDSSGIDLQLQGSSGDLSSFIPNGEWELIGLPANRNVVSYECCPEQYIDITMIVHIRRRTLYYGFNLIIPCVLISSMALLAFQLPPDSGEKISLGVTIMLSLTVFLLLVAETMPPTSDAVPLIGMYFACIMMMCSLSVVFTVLVLNFHHRSPGTHHMPRWVQIGICEWMARLLCMSRPVIPAPKEASSSNSLDSGRRLSRSGSLRSSYRRRSMRDLAGHDVTMLETVDVTSVSTGVVGPLVNVFDSSKGDWCKRCTSLNGGMRRPGLTGSNTSSFISRAGGPLKSTSEEPSTQQPAQQHSQAVRLLREILTELRQLTDKAAKDDDIQDEINDWRFAAMVVDRLCLVVFTLFTVISTFAILFSAPHIIV